MERRIKREGRGLMEWIAVYFIDVKTANLEFQLFTGREAKGASKILCASRRYMYVFLV